MRRTYRTTNRNIQLRWAVAIAIAAVLCIGLWLTLSGKSRKAHHEEVSAEEVIVKDTLYRYGLPIEYFAITHDTVAPRQTLADLLDAYTS